MAYFTPEGDLQPHLKKKLDDLLQDIEDRYQPHFLEVRNEAKRLLQEWEKAKKEYMSAMERHSNARARYLSYGDANLCRQMVQEKKQLKHDFLRHLLLLEKAEAVASVPTPGKLKADFESSYEIDLTA